MFHIDDLLNTRKRLVFYGAKTKCRRFIKEFCVERRNIRLPDYICDPDQTKWGSEIYGVQIVPPQTLQAENPNNMVIVVTTNPFVVGDLSRVLYFNNFVMSDAIEMELALFERSDDYQRVLSMFSDEQSLAVILALTRGVVENRIWFRDIYSPEPYFGNDVVPTLPAGSVIVDGGAYRGAHINRAFKLNGAVTAHAFEPTSEYAKSLHARFGADGRVQIHETGLYSYSGDAHFSVENPTGERIVDVPSDRIIKVARLDDLAIDATFIKLDIEGAEIEMLLGAAETIRRQRPTLAISVYHRRPAHYLDITLLVRELLPDSKLYMRQHSCYPLDTVLYAISGETSR